jgi:hypothetical protein
VSTRLRNFAQANAEIVAKGAYTTDDGVEVVVRAALDAAIAGTVSHQPGEHLEPPRPGARTTFEVTPEGSLQAAGRLHLDGGSHIAVLNFASARNPGGGYLGGAKAQEEDLCRHALLYPCLLRAPDHERAGRVLAVAAHHGARRLVLGAWGCGVFRNDPHEVADAFHTHLTGDGAFAAAFDQVVFAVWDRAKVSANRAAFAARFS